MFAEPSARTQDLLTRMRAFFDEHIYPNEARHAEEAERSIFCLGIPSSSCSTGAVKPSASSRPRAAAHVPAR